MKSDVLPFVPFIVLIIVLAMLSEVKHPATAQAASRNVIDVFNSRPTWKELPSEFLKILSKRLISEEKAKDFIELCEDTGILENNIVNLADFDPDFAIGGVAATLTSYANTMGDQMEFNRAKRALEFAILLKPRFVPAWSSMAIFFFNMGNCGAAVSWADKVLAFKPDSGSKDPWEGGAFGEPEMIEAWKQLQEQMEVIRDACPE